MDKRANTSPRLTPLPVNHSPELRENFEFAKKSLGFVPNSMLIMQRKPKLVKAFSQLSQAIWDPECEVDRGFKRLIGHVASRAAGCVYCMAHTAEGAKPILGATTLLAGLAFLPGLDKTIGAALVSSMPEWLAGITTRF